jgi:hypothetical protein
MKTIETIGEATKWINKHSGKTYTGRYITGHKNIISLITEYNRHLLSISDMVIEYEKYLEQLPERDKDAERTLLTVHLFAESADKLIRYQYAIIKDIPVSKYSSDDEKLTSENIIKTLRYQLIINGIQPMI